MPELDTQIPAWLQRNWTPKEPFDPTPWLQERYRRQVEQQVMPLKIQQLQLQNQEAQLKIDEQGMSNELHSLQLNQMRQELPALQQMKFQTKGDPKSVLDYPVQSFSNPLVQKQYLDYVHSAANTGYGISLQQRIIDQTKEAAKAMAVPGTKILRPGPDGLFDEEEMQFNRAIVDEHEQKQKLDAIKAQHPTVTPQALTIYDDNGNPITMVQEGPSSWKPVDTTTTEVKTPDGTILSIKSGAKGSGSISGNNQSVDSAIQKKITDSDRSLALISETMPLITPETVGPVGVAKELIEIVGGVVSPGSTGTDVNAARQTMRMTIQNQLSSLKADSQINKTEAAQINAISDITGIKMSADVAKRKYSILQDLTALQNILNHHQLNKFAPDNALRAISEEQMARAFDRKDVTEAEVIRWNEIHGAVK